MTPRHPLSALGAPLLACVLALSACGGGGGDAVDPPSGTAPLEGAYGLATSTGLSGEALVLSGGSIWALSGVSSGGSIYVSSFTHGSIDRSGGSLSASDLRQYDLVSSTASALGFSGTINGAGIVSGTLTPSIGPASTVTLTPVSARSFDFEAPATLAAVTGTWNGRSADGSSGSVTVSSGGAVAGSLGGCSLSGTVAPHPSGKHLYSVSIVFGPAPCLLPSATVNGIAYLNESAAVPQLLVMVVTPDRSAGTILVATH